MHKEPHELFLGPWFPDTGPCRYDDPDGSYAVRYLGGTVDCCLKELLDRGTRPDEKFEERLAAFGSEVDGEGIEETEEDDDLDQYDLPPGPDHTLDDYDGWLPAQRVARLTSAEPAAVVDHDDVLKELATHSRVRNVLDALCLTELTHELIRRKDRIAYRVTQAISAAIHHDHAWGGLAYQSCVDVAEQCWALYGRTAVEPVGECAHLFDGGENEAALRRAAAFVGVALPERLFRGPTPAASR